VVEIFTGSSLSTHDWLALDDSTRAAMGAYAIAVDKFGFVIAPFDPRNKNLCEWRATDLLLNKASALQEPAAGTVANCVFDVTTRQDGEDDEVLVVVRVGADGVARGTELTVHYGAHYGDASGQRPYDHGAVGHRSTSGGLGGGAIFAIVDEDGAYAVRAVHRAVVTKSDDDETDASFKQSAHSGANAMESLPSRALRSYAAGDSDQARHNTNRDRQVKGMFAETVARVAGGARRGHHRVRVP